jgi:hypothetical protein
MGRFGRLCARPASAHRHTSITTAWVGLRMRKACLQGIETSSNWIEPFMLVGKSICFYLLSDSSRKLYFLMQQESIETSLESDIMGWFLVLSIV